jgi:hypothetical protein
MRAAAAGFCTLIGVLAAPGVAAAGLVPQSESHELSAHASVNNGPVFGQVVPGSRPAPTSPISAQASAQAGPGAAASTFTGLNLSFNGGSISGSLLGDSRFHNDVFPQSGSGDTSGGGNFNVTFSVTEATPFTLGGVAQGTAMAPGDFGHARLTLSEAGSDLLAFDSRDATVPGSFFSFGAGGTLLPGHIYAVVGSVENGVRTSAGGAASGSVLVFTLAVPEPAGLSLLAPAALLVLRRHRR